MHYQNIQGLFPITVYRPVALVDDDKVKEIMRELWIVRKRYFFALVVVFIALTIRNIFSFQEREQSLNSRYDHIAVRREPG